MTANGVICKDPIIPYVKRLWIIKNIIILLKYYCIFKKMLNAINQLSKFEFETSPIIKKDLFILIRE